MCVGFAGCWRRWLRLMRTGDARPLDRIRRAAPFPAFVMPPWRRVAPLECSDGPTEIAIVGGDGEAGDVAEFASPSPPRPGHPAHRLQGAHHRGQRPIRQRRRDMASRRSRRAVAASRRDAVFQHDVMRRLLESQSGHPATVLTSTPPMCDPYAGPGAADASRLRAAASEQPRDRWPGDGVRRMALRAPSR